MDPAARGPPRAHRVGPLGVINWGGVALGAATGIVAGLLLNLAVDVILPWESSIPPTVIHFSATVGAGYIAGRFAVSGPAHNGVLAGLGLFLFAGVVAVITADGPTLIELVILGVVAGVLGAAGGALADRRRTV